MNTRRTGACRPVILGTKGIVATENGALDISPRMCGHRAKTGGQIRDSASGRLGGSQFGDSSRSGRGSCLS
jgi:hypothetical protein